VKVVIKMPVLGRVNRHTKEVLETLSCIRAAMPAASWVFAPRALAVLKPARKGWEHHIPLWSRSASSPSQVWF